MERLAACHKSRDHLLQRRRKQGSINLHPPSLPPPQQGETLQQHQGLGKDNNTETDSLTLQGQGAIRQTEQCD